MRSAPTIRATKHNRVAHPYARSASALLLFTAASLLHAQSAPCGLTSITDHSPVAYPPIARAAHVGGTVILLVRFGQDGAATAATVLSGPAMLKDAALAIAKGWRANEYSGPRECPFAIDFNIISDKPVCTYEEAGPPHVKRSDLQHVSVSVRSIWTCDPSAAITTTTTRKRWF